MAYNVRAIKPEEIEGVRSFIPPGDAEPIWANCLVVEHDGEIVGVGGIQVRYVVEPLYMKRTDVPSLCFLIGELDQAMRGLGTKEYEFFVQDKHEKFQAFIEKYLPVEKGREKPGLYYFRRF